MTFFCAFPYSPHLSFAVLLLNQSAPVSSKLRSEVTRIRSVYAVKQPANTFHKVSLEGSYWTRGGHGKKKKLLATEIAEVKKIFYNHSKTMFLL
ncbi:hypothetical protein XELAEV_18025697mg [Xenopus laevis]|uniref:Uncharacterized protein n=1 Tax=Xenopus laevis TaxID=8355 RepID=A0A974D053_XENLA|nr:hypothetical protein XELAEV_18025697mg [Xenopus laevis]